MKQKPCRRCMLLMLLVLVGGGLFGTAFELRAQDEATPQGSKIPTVMVINMTGTAQILSRKEQDKQQDKARILGVPAPETWKPARRNTQLSLGDQIRTGVDSSMELRLDDGTSIVLAGDTAVLLEVLKSVRAGQPKTTQFKLEKGMVSTKQPSKILGQTNQAIRTDNGAVYTRLGEVTVQKAERKFVKLATVSEQWPLLAQGSRVKDVTTVTLTRGSADIEASGTGQMKTLSYLLPNTCPGEDGIQFTLQNPKEKVTVAKLTDDNGFRLSSAENFLLLAGINGLTNKIRVSTRASEGVLDVEGMRVAELSENSRSVIELHPLLTVGVTSKDLFVQLECSEFESKGITDFKVQAETGGVNIVRSSLGGPETSLIPSRGALSEAVPTAIPTVAPTETPVPGEASEVTPTVTPTPVVVPEPGEEPTPTPTPGPTPVPVTHSFGKEPVIKSYIVSSQENGPGCSGLYNYRIDVDVNYENYLPTIVDGRLVSVLTDDTWTPQATFTYPIPDPTRFPPPYLTVLSYNYSWPKERGSLSYNFCYIRSEDVDQVYFRFFLEDFEGNCSDEVMVSHILQ